MKRKNEQGFTLVEVIVVAVIVAVLAAVAIPLYNGYIADSRTNVCQNTAGTVAGALVAAVGRGQTPVAGWLVGQILTIPPDPNVLGSTANVITIPAGFTANIVWPPNGTVTITGPNASTSTPVPYQ